MAVFGGLWGNPYLQTAYHLDQTQSASLVTVSFLGLAVGGPLFGWLASVFNKSLPFMLTGTSLSLLSVCYVDFSPASSLALLTVALFLFGLGTGAFMLGFAMGRMWFPASLAASMVALVNTGDALFGAFSEPLVGKLLDHFGGGHTVNGVHVFSLHAYHLALTTMPVYLVVALGMLYFVKKYN